MKFKYEAMNKSGRVESGFIESEGENFARSEIKNRGLYLVNLREVSNKQESKTLFHFKFGSNKRLAMRVARQLASLLKGGVPLYQALNIMIGQLQDDKEKEIINSVKERVREGSSLSDALKAYPGVFDDLFVYSVQAGERSGALDAILNYMAEFLENRAVMKGRIRAALMYPLIMSTIGLGVLMFLMGYVVPMVIKIFDRMNQELPLPTKILIGTAHFMNSYAVILIVILGFLIYGLRVWLKRSQEAQKVRDNLLLNLPLFGTLYRMMLIGRFTRIMATLLKSGVTMVQSLVVVSQTMKNRIISENIRSMAEMVERGTDLSATLRETPVFPSYVADMVTVGESSGNLEDMLSQVSDYYEIDLNQRIAAFTAMVEPFVILVIGMIVAFVLVSVLLPLFDLNKLLMKR
jgi:general secretion pathway protein F